MNSLSNLLPDMFIVKEAERFVRNLFATSLPEHMLFHSIDHTQYVVSAVTEIGFYSGISFEEMIIVKTAAWFHDAGYCYTYNGHEDTSIAIGSTFLSQQGCAAHFIEDVTSCILATKVPQNPTNQLQEIICDADLAHLADENYLHISEKLKLEWQYKLGKKFTKAGWRKSNLDLLSRHTYFTQYGRTFLEAAKQQNVELLQKTD